MSWNTVQLGMVGTGVYPCLSGNCLSLHAYDVSLSSSWLSLSYDGCVLCSSCFWDLIPAVFQEKTFQSAYSAEQPGLTGSTSNSQETNLAVNQASRRARD